MASRAMLLSFLLLGAAPMAAGQCSDAWQNCSASMCCYSPFFQCIEKNQGGKVNGQDVLPYAQCRDSRAIPHGACPCDTGPDGSTPCTDTSEKSPANEVPWTCVQLTGGCSKEFEPCGAGEGYLAENEPDSWRGTPCCQWGCHCDYDDNKSWEIQCKPKETAQTCKDEDDDGPDYDSEMVAEYEDGKDIRRSSISDGRKGAIASARQGTAMSWFAPGACALALAAVVGGLVLRKRQIQNLQQGEPLADVEAEGLYE